MEASELSKFPCSPELATLTRMVSSEAAQPLPAIVSMSTTTTTAVSADTLVECFSFVIAIPSVAKGPLLVRSQSHRPQVLGPVEHMSRGGRHAGTLETEVDPTVEVYGWFMASAFSHFSGGRGDPLPERVAIAKGSLRGGCPTVMSIGPDPLGKMFPSD